MDIAYYVTQLGKVMGSSLWKYDRENKIQFPNHCTIYDIIYTGFCHHILALHCRDNYDIIHTYSHKLSRNLRLF
jgi:hypothetical protein